MIKSVFIHSEKKLSRPVLLSILIHPCNNFAFHQAGRKIILSSSMVIISFAFTVIGSAQSSKSTSYWIVPSLFLEYSMTSYIPDSPVPGERMNCLPWRLSGVRNSWSSSAVIRLGSMDGLERGNSRLLTVGGVGCEGWKALLHNKYNIDEKQYDDQASYSL